MQTIVTFCGSASAVSANRAALDVVARAVVARGIGVTDAGAFDDVPMFRPELVDEAPSAVARLRAGFEAADAVVLAVPEYAGGMAGWVKNALDWMVGSGSLYQRPVAVLSAGTTGGANAVEQAARTLTWQGALVVATLGIASPRTKADDTGRFTDPGTLALLDGVADSLVVASAADDASRRAMATATLAPLGLHLLDQPPA